MSSRVPKGRTLGSLQHIHPLEQPSNHAHKDVSFSTAPLYIRKSQSTLSLSDTKSCVEFSSSSKAASIKKMKELKEVSIISKSDSQLSRDPNDSEPNINPKVENMSEVAPIPIKQQPDQTTEEGGTPHSRSSNWTSFFRRTQSSTSLAVEPEQKASSIHTNSSKAVSSVSDSAASSQPPPTETQNPTIIEEPPKSQQVQMSSDDDNKPQQPSQSQSRSQNDKNGWLDWMFSKSPEKANPNTVTTETTGNTENTENTGTINSKSPEDRELEKKKSTLNINENINKPDSISSRESVSSSRSHSEDTNTSNEAMPDKDKETSRGWFSWSKDTKDSNNINKTSETQIEPGSENIPDKNNTEQPPTEVMQNQRNEINDSSPSKKLKKKSHSNLVIPPIEKCLNDHTRTRSLILSLKQFSNKLGLTTNNVNHLLHCKPHLIKKVLIIGVHGFFPNKRLRRLIGEPTGTSVRFVNQAEIALLKWSNLNGFKIDIKKIALEREGKVLDRVSYFKKILEKNSDDIKKSDFIFFVAHSQGTPVSVHLASYLIESGLINTKNNNQRIGILAMAGISLGPFYGMDKKILVRAYSSFENESMMELFEFQNLKSLQSNKYLESLKTIIKNNVKITFIGSINDQLVPLYSSTCMHINHPNIFRAVYIDGESDTPNFVSSFVEIAFRLRNIGRSEHQVIKEISNSLSGNLTGGGHSNLYNEEKVYNLAIRFILETTDNSYSVPLDVDDFFKIESSGVNPYNLPWCMRGLLFEASHLNGGDLEVNEIFKQYDEWDPVSKPLKDMKYRLNAIKSKL